MHKFDVNELHKSSSKWSYKFLFPIWVMALLAFGTLMHTAQVIFIWIISSLFLFALLDPLHRKIKKRKWMPSNVSAVLLVVVATLLTVGVLFLVGSFSARILVELQRSKQVLFDYYNLLNEKLKIVTDTFGQISHNHQAPAGSTPLQPRITQVQVVESGVGKDMEATLIQGFGSAVTVLTFAFLIPILTFFLLLDRNSLAQAIQLKIKDKSKASRLWRKIIDISQAYFLGNVVLALVTFPLYVSVFYLFDVTSLFTTAVLATAFNLIPFVGSLSGIIPALTLLAEQQGFGVAAGVFAACLFIHFVVANLVTPKILGSKVDVNAVTSTIALIVWGELWGGIGLLLAIPITAMIKVCLEESSNWTLRWIATLMSERSVEVYDHEEEHKPLAAKG